MWYQWWDTGWPITKRAREIQPRWIAAAEDRDVLIKWEPWKPGRQIVQPRFTLESIVGGAHDPYVIRWAQAIRSLGRPIYLCPMPEPNGFWNGWSSVIGKHEPSLYPKAWCHLHRLFRDQGADNVKWVWNPNAGDAPETNRMEDYYPGSEFVDVLGLSVYNWGTVRSWSRWQSFGQIFLPYYDRISQLGNQPIWIAEMGCAPIGGDRDAWLEEMAEILPKLDRLKCMIWFDAKKETDWRITNQPDLCRVISNSIR